jgi:hypothetical protein
MDDLDARSCQFEEAYMNVEAWVELLIVIFRILAAGMAA